MYLLFIKGNRGLVANEDGKYYFPDRRSNIVEEGLYDCEITVDKDKYAFVKGKLVDTCLPSKSDVINLFYDVLSADPYPDPYPSIQSYVYVLAIGKSNIIVSYSYSNFDNESFYTFAYADEQEGATSIKTLFEVHPGKHNIYTEFGNYMEHPLFKKQDIIMQAAVELDDKVKMEVLSNALKKIDQRAFKIINIEIYHNKIIGIAKKYRQFHCSPRYTYFMYFAKDDFSSLREIYINNFTHYKILETYCTTDKDIEQIDIKDIVKYRIDAAMKK